MTEERFLLTIQGEQAAGSVSYGSHFAGFGRLAGSEHGGLQMWPVAVIGRQLLLGDRLEDVVKVRRLAARMRSRAVNYVQVPPPRFVAGADRAGQTTAYAAVSGCRSRPSQTLI
jgi:hypothetical protein